MTHVVTACKYYMYETADAPISGASFTPVVYDAGVALLCHNCYDTKNMLWWCTWCGYIECDRCSNHGHLCGYHFAVIWK